MIALVVEYPCQACGVALRVPMMIRPQRLPVRLDGVVVPALPEGWTYDAAGAHCPAHQPSRVIPATLIPPGILKGT